MSSKPLAGKLNSASLTPTAYRVILCGILEKDLRNRFKDNSRINTSAVTHLKYDPESNITQVSTINNMYHVDGNIIPLGLSYMEGWELFMKLSDLDESDEDLQEIKEYYDESNN